jgi:ubiquitin-protein ligase
VTNPPPLPQPTPEGPGTSGTRLQRLQSDYEAVRRLARLHGKISLEGVSGNPPFRYRLVMDVRSLREMADGRIVVVTPHKVEVTLPQGYPRDAPVCRMLTPVFHPNVAPHAIGIGDGRTSAESLADTMQRIGEMLAFRSYDLKSPLNGRAARWVEENLGRLPIDESEFFRDLADAPEPQAAPVAAAACANCGKSGVALASCGAGHDLCPACDATCPTCGAVLCLVCGRTTCSACEVPNCSNCGAADAKRMRCAGRHALCADCGTTCATCNRSLCVVCGEYPCRACAVS